MNKLETPTSNEINFKKQIYSYKTLNGDLALNIYLLRCRSHHQVTGIALACPVMILSNDDSKVEYVDLIDSQKEIVDREEFLSRATTGAGRRFHDNLVVGAAIKNTLISIGGVSVELLTDENIKNWLYTDFFSYPDIDKKDVDSCLEIAVKFGLCDKLALRDMKKWNAMKYLLRKAAHINNQNQKQKKQDE